MRKLTMNDLFTPENSDDTYVKIETYNEAAKEIKELKDKEKNTKFCPRCQMTIIDQGALEQIKDLKEDRLSFIMWLYEEVASHPLSLENAESFLEDYLKEHIDIGWNIDHDMTTTIPNSEKLTFGDDSKDECQGNTKH